MKTTQRELGAVNPLVISNVLLAVFAVGLGAVMVWALVNYNDQKNNVDSKIAVAVTAAKEEQSAQDEKDFLEREKAPYIQYVGPEDLGRVTLNYPKTWSVYTAKTSSSGMEVYFHPVMVPTVQNKQQFATIVKVVDRSNEQILKSYEALIKKGDLKSSQVVVNGFSGTRLDGTFQNDIKGSMVIFKLRDKTLTIETGAESFRPDFNNIILKSLDFNP